MAGGAAGYVLVFQWLPNGDACSDPRQWQTGRFCDKRHGSGRARVDLQHVEVLALDGELNVEATHDVQAETDDFCLLCDAFEHGFRDVLCRNKTGRIPRMNAGFLEVFHDSTNEHLLTV